MNWSTFFKDDPSLLSEIREGVEKECLRLDMNGVASNEAHAKKLGSKLTHAKITTDYAENLLEFITPVHHNSHYLLEELADLQAFTYLAHPDELLSPGSMPGVIGAEGDIQVADYGESNSGKLKSLYRTGLGYRYGKSMQSIAGVHYNFSFTDKFWDVLKVKSKSELSLRDFKNERYFSLIRNYRRYSWILTYLFGASPLVDESFLVGKSHKLERINTRTFATRYGTSLRMGGLGYTSSAQDQISVCFNKVETYIKTLERARLQSIKEYENIEVEGELRQLNTNLLQIDNEFYSTIRPKNIARSGESALQAIHRRGIEYVEVRLLDLNPFTPLGIDEETIIFLRAFLTWCLVSDSPLIGDVECSEIQSNFSKIIELGRSPGLKLVKEGQLVSREKYLEDVFDELSELSSSFPPKFKRSIEEQRNKIANLNLLPSQKLYEQGKERDLKDIYIDLASKYKKEASLSQNKIQYFEGMAKSSIGEQLLIEKNDKEEFSDFLEGYFEAIKINF